MCRATDCRNIVAEAFFCCTPNFVRRLLFSLEFIAALLYIGSTISCQRHY